MAGGATAVPLADTGAPVWRRSRRVRKPLGSRVCGGVPTYVQGSGACCCGGMVHSM